MTVPGIIATTSLAAIAGIWLGYPVIVWLIASLKPASPATVPNAKTSSVSVILATRDAAEVVRARIANLLATAHPAKLLEIIVALDFEGAQSTPAELSGLGSNVVVVKGDAPGGKAAALNAGVRAARGELLVLADAQQRYDEHTIPELVSSLDDSRFGAVSGALELGRASSGSSPVDWYWRLEKWLRYNEARVHSSVGVTGAVYATRRALWPVVPAGTLLDDVYVPMALVMGGHRIGFNYAARAYDVRTFNAQHETVRKTRTLTGVLQLRHLLPDILSPAKNPIALQFVAHKLLRLITPILAVIFGASLLVVIVQMLLHATQTERAVAALVVVACLVLPVTRRVIVAGVRWALSLQLATTRAIVNGVGGRWGVWNKPRN